MAGHTYTYEEHDGADIITVDKTDTIKIDIVGSELKYRRNGNDLLIQYSDDVGDVLTLENFFSGSYVETESVFDTIKVLTEEPGVYDDQSIMAANINVEMTSTSFTGVDIKTGGEVVGGYKENIIGTALSDTIDGSSGNDTIDGGLGSDLIIGGKGDDILTGGSDEEINNFRFDSNDGNDTVTDAKSIDILGFKNLLFKDLTFIRNTDDLEISYNTTNKVTVSDFFNSASKIDTVQILDAGDNVIDTKSILADGTINVNLDEFVETYHATSYNEYFTGSGTIDNWVAGKTAKFSSSTTYTLDENGLLISGDNQILITDFTDTYALPTVYVGEDIESVTGKTLTVSGLTDFNGSTMAFNHYEITGTDDVDNLTGGTGNDTIEAGKGNDNIVGYGGADTFVFNTGDGVDTITNANSSSTLRIKDLLSNASFERCEELGFETSLIINYGSGDKIKVIDYFKYVNPDYVKNDNVVTTFVFNDSEGNPVTYDLEWKKSDATGEFAMYNVVNDPAEIIEELPNWVIAPSGDNEINGSENNFDILIGNTGNDTITAGPNGAEMYGNAGNDILNGSDVKDYIYGGDDNDTITGNKGYDVIDGGDGNNIFIFNAGDGVDTIENIHSGDEIQINVINATLTYTRNINDLEISYTENDKIILKDFFAAGYVDIETVFDTIKVLNSEQGYNLYSLKDQIIDVTVEDGVPFTGVDIKTASVVTDGYKENITGTDNNDTIDGGYGNDKILGGEGDDTLSGNNGNDEIHGGDGTDTINGGDGNDLIYGNDGNDTINGDNGDDEIYGGAGTDTINGGDGADEIHGDDDNDIINGGAGADKIYGDAGDDEIHGGDNNDVIYGGIGNDQIYGDAGNDEIHGGEGEDTINGGDGDDEIHGDTNNDTLTGGLGSDTFIFNAGDGIDTITDAEKVDEIIINVEDAQLTFSRNINNDLEITYTNDDKIILQNFFNTEYVNTETVFNTVKVLKKSGGYTTYSIRDQIINAVVKNDVNFVGVDIKTGGIIVGGYKEKITGTTSADTIYSRSGDDEVHGGAGNDTIYGDTGNDKIYGDGDGDIIYGGAGEDTIYGGEGEDTINGGDNDDEIHGGTDNDTLTGGDGSDTFVFNAGDGEDTITDAYRGDVIKINVEDAELTFTRKANNDLEIAYTENDKIILRNFFSGDFLHTETVFDTIKVLNSETGEFDTISLKEQLINANVVYDNNFIGVDIKTEGIVTDGYNEKVTGTDGNDTIYGNSGNDEIHGGEGEDTIYGGNGDDVIYSDENNDTLTGGDGSNTFVFKAGDGIDTITDAKKGDVIKIDVEDAELTFTRKANNDLEIAYTNSDKIILQNFFASEYVNIETVFDTIKVLNSETGEFDTLSLKEQIINANVQDGIIFNGIDIKENSVVIGGYNENITGTDIADTIYGNSGDDEIHGGDGNDTIYGGDDNDIIYGDAGDDTIDGGDGINEIHGGDGNDTINGGDGVNEIYGGAGTDTINCGNGDDIIYGDAGNDTIDGGDGVNEIHGGEDNDTITGGDDDDTIYGDEGDDTINGNAGDDEIHGGDGEDTINGGDGNDTIYGDDGNDEIYGNAGNDEIYGNEGNDEIHGGAGEDTIDGGDNDDEIHGGTDNDTLTGGNGNNTFVFNTGDGIDTITDAKKGDVIKIDVDNAQLTFTRNSTDDLVIAYTENDKIILKEFFAQGYVNENTVFDTIKVYNSEIGDYVTLSLKDQTIISTVKEETTFNGIDIKNGEEVVGGYNEKITGTDIADTIYGNAGDDEIHGGAGEDTINGGNGNDVIYGNAGDDNLYCGAGNDKLYGGTGNDNLYSGEGNNTFVFETGDGKDTITDATNNDIAQFKQIEFNSLTFTRIEDDLVINKSTDSVTISDFFNAESKLNTIQIINAEEAVTETKTILDNAWIKVSVSDDYTATNYHEIIKTTASCSISNLSENDKLDFSDTDFASLNFLRNKDNLIIIDGETETTIKNYFKNVAELENVVVLTTDETPHTLSDAVYTEYVATNFKNLTFSRQGNNLLTSYNEEVIVRENFFGAANYDTLLTLDEGKRVSHSILEEGIIYASNVSTYTGYDITADTGYFDNITVGYQKNISYDVENEIITTHYNESGEFKSAILGNCNNDVIYGSTKSDWLNGGKGKDVIYSGSAGNDVLLGKEGEDILVGGALNLDGSITYSNSDITFYGGADNDTITGGLGNDTISGDEGNDTLTGNSGSNIFVFAQTTGFGTDTITDATQYDTIQFALDNLSGYKRSELKFTQEGKNLVIKAQKGGETKGTVVINDYYNTIEKYQIDKLIVLSEDGTHLENSQIVLPPEIDIHIEPGDSPKYKGSNNDEGISAETYVPTKGVTGVTITTGTGNNTVIGSKYNDTINASKAKSLNVTEIAGTNKITSGKGSDTIILDGTSSNTVSAGAGNNTIEITSTGKNKITAGNDGNTIFTENGINTINAGNGANTVSLDGGTNKLTTGKSNDSIQITDGKNTIKSGAGNDKITVNNGTNNINTGSGQSTVFVYDGNNTILSGSSSDTYTVSAGMNNIKTSAGNDDITITGGNNSIDTGAGIDVVRINGGKSTINGGAGDDVFYINNNDGNLNITGGAGKDTYDMSSYENILLTNNIIVNDSSGANILKLSNDYTKNNLSIYVDITLNKKKAPVINGEWKLAQKGITEASDISGVDFTGGTKSSMSLSVNGSFYLVDKNTLKEIATDVANWMANNTGFTSTDALIQKGSKDEVAGLLAQFDSASAKYVFNIK